MQRIKLLSFGLVASFVAAVGIAGVVSATWSPNFRTDDESVVLAKDETHKGSFYTVGESVTIDGTITGSLYCAGSNVTINGTVEGDVLCAGQKLTINGTVGQDVRAAGQFVQVDGTIGGSLTVFGQDIRLANGASVAGDVNGAAQQFTLDGSVGRDVAVGTQLLALNGEVKGNVDIASEKVQLGSQAVVTGNFNYTAEGQLSFDESRVQGEVSFNPVEYDHQQSSKQFVSGARIAFLLMLAVSALAIVLIMPRFLSRSSKLFSRQPFTVMLLGFAFVFGGPIVVGLLLFSVILFPLGLALLFGWLTILVLSGIFFAYWVGTELLRSQPNAIVRMLGGIVVVLILYLIPFINALAMLAAAIVGSGMIISTLTNGYRRPDYRIPADKTVAANSK